MIGTRSWDSLFIYFHYQKGHREAHICLFCLLIVGVIWKLIRACMGNEHQQE